MARMKTYERQPQKSSGTAKISGSSGVGQALAGLGQSFEDVGQVLEQYQKVKDVGQHNSFAVALDEKINAINLEANKIENGEFVHHRDERAAWAKDQLDEWYKIYKKNNADKVSQSMADKIDMEFQEKSDEMQFNFRKQQVEEEAQSALVNTQIAYKKAIVEDKGKERISELESQLTEFMGAPKAKKFFDKTKTEIANDAVTQEMMLNPQRVLDKINEQMRGEKTYYDLNMDDLKSARAYARKIKAERQTQTALDLYAPDSEYQEMSPEEKLKYLKDEHSKGNLSTKAYKSLAKDAKEPSFYETTPEMQQKWLDLRTEAFKNEGNKLALAGVLQKAMAAYMPRGMKSSVVELVGMLQDPTSSFYNAQFKLASETISSAFDEEILPKITGRLSPMRMGEGAYVEDYTEETKDKLFIQAQYEAQTRVYNWLRTDGKDAPAEDIQKKVAQVIVDVKRRYSIPFLPDRIQEIKADETDEASNADKGWGVEEQEEYTYKISEEKEATFSTKEDYEAFKDKVEKSKQSEETTQ